MVEYNPKFYHHHSIRLSGYNFSKARTPKQTAEVSVSGLVGLTYKDVESIKSLIKTIHTEIEGLINENLKS